MTLTERLEKGFIRLNQWLVIGLMAGIVSLVFLNVVARYGFGNSFGWAEELSRFGMIWIAFLGCGLALRYGQLVTMDAVQNALPTAAQRLLRHAALILVVAFLALLVWVGTQFVLFSWRNQTAVTQIPRGIPYIAVPLGAAFILIHLLFCWKRFVAREFDPFIHLEDLPDEARADAREPTGHDGRGAS